MKRHILFFLILVGLMNFIPFLMKGAEQNHEASFTLVRKEEGPFPASPGRTKMISEEVFQRMEQQVEEIARLRVALQDLKRSFQANEIDKESLQDLVSTLREQIHEMSEHAVESEAQLLELTEAKLLQERTLSELQKNHEHLKKDEETLRLELEQARVTVEEQKRLVLAEKEINRRLQEESALVVREKSDLQETVERQEQQIARLQERELIIRKQATAIEELQGELQETKLLLQKETKKVQQLEEQVRDQQDLLDRSLAVASADTSFAGEESLVDALAEHPSVQHDRERGPRAEALLTGLRGQIQLLLQTSVNAQEKSRQLATAIELLRAAKVSKEGELRQLQTPRDALGARTSLLERLAYRSELAVASPELALATGVAGLVKGLYDKRKSRQSTQQRMAILQREIDAAGVELERMEEQKRVCDENIRLHEGLSGLLS